MNNEEAPWLEEWPEVVDLTNVNQVHGLLAEMNVTEERLRRAVASVGTDMRPVAAYLYEEEVEFGPDADTIAATGRRPAAAEEIGPQVAREVPYEAQLDPTDKVPVMHESSQVALRIPALHRPDASARV